MDEEQSSGQVGEETSSNAVIRNLSKAGLLYANGKATDKDKNRDRCLKENLAEYLIFLHVLKKLYLLYHTTKARGQNRGVSGYR